MINPHIRNFIHEIIFWDSLPNCKASKYMINCLRNIIVSMIRLSKYEVWRDQNDKTGDKEEKRKTN